MDSLSNPRSRVATLGAAIFVGLVAIAIWTYFDSHSHSHDEPSVLSLDNGKRWPTDEPLRAGMERIRAAADPVAAAFARRQLTTDAAKIFSTAVTTSFAEIARTCKLAPKADVTLHALVTELLRGAGQLSSDPTSAEGMEVVRKVLRRYPEYFDHPGWKPLPDVGA